MSLALGIAVRDITPLPGLPMGGYAARFAPAEATLDPLVCRAAVWRAADGAGAALIVLDLLYVRDPWATATRGRVARRLGVDGAAVLIAATHTHAGPAVFGAAMRPNEALLEYERQLADIVDAAVEEAAAGMRPAQLSYGVARTDAVAANRREVDGEHDADVRCLVARADDGELLGVVATYGCHPTVLPPANLAYSRDLFGAAVGAAESELLAPVLLFNGAAADVSTRFTRQAQTPAEAMRLGKRLAEGLLAAVRGSNRIDGAPLAGRCVEVALQARRLPSPEQAEEQLRTAAAALESARQHATGAELRRLTSQVEGAAAQLYFSRRGGIEALMGEMPERARLQVVRLGGCDILGVPGEMFSAIGRGIYARRPRPALLVGYANDYVGYLVPPGSGDGYEALMAFVTEDSAAAIADRLATVEAT